jgi:hypothetical protein
VVSGITVEKFGLFTFLSFGIIYTSMRINNLRGNKMYYIYKNQKNLFISIVSLLITLLSVIVTLIVLIDRKNKKDEKEIDDYLENSIQ